MQVRVKPLVIVWNCIILLSVMMTWFLFTGDITMKTGAIITSLDREKVFDEVRLKKSCPEIAQNVRGKLTGMLCEPYLRAAGFTVQIMVFLVVVNIVLLLLLRERIPSERGRADPLGERGERDRDD
ncbi:MAG: hypothetical protein JW809_13465 [Pirellulales bacterium]|nr:hypothetical protein [Pirellulales bacterium]